jgi:hypothetical protein
MNDSKTPDHKIWCRYDGVTLVVGTSLPKEIAGHLTGRDIKEIGERLKRRKGSTLSGFASTPAGVDDQCYELSATVGIYTQDWDVCTQLMFFRDEVEKLTKVPCCIDVSGIPSQSALRQLHVVKTKSTKAPKPKRRAA